MPTNKKMLVSDYILDFLVSQGVRKVFLITGGAIAFVVDAFSRRKDIEYICVAHEQAGAMMADAYSRLGPGQAATMVTSGPGATNLITGICCSHFDSIPVIHISGQVNQYEMRGAHPGTSDARQVGFQETQIVDIVAPITKWAYQIKTEKEIRYVLEKADYISKSGLPGPVVIDIPMNFQRAEINPAKLKGFKPPKNPPYRDTGKALEKKVRKMWEMLVRAHRPVIVSVGGVRLAGALDEFHKLAKLTGFPLVTSWSGFDSISFNHKQYVGSHGVYGYRSANFTVQNADVLLTVGSRLDTRQTGGRPETYAREAKIIMVDIDRAELAKRRGLTPHLSIETDAKEFLNMMLKHAPSKKELPNISDWNNITRQWKNKYPMVQKVYYKQKHVVNVYVFVKELSDQAESNAVIIPDDGGHLTWAMQAWELKKGQRMFSAFGNSPMGYAFPASLGASVALNKKPIICIDGDGSLLMNIQEMQTMVNYKLPVKVFIFNNQGYGIIRQFQELYLDRRFEATGKKNDVTVPDFMRIAEGFGIKGIRINSHIDMKRKIQQVLSYKGPVLCEVMLNSNQKIIPKLMFGNPIEDLSPLIPRDEFKKNMIIEAIKADKSLTEAN